MSWFVLLLLAGLQAEPAPTSQPEQKEKLICKREVPVGSLIATRKMCLTKTQWRERADVGNEVARRMMMDNMGNSNCLNGGGC